MRVYCSKLEQNVIVKAENISWSACDQECDLCGSHGDIKADFRCACGRRHKLELHSW